MTAAMTKRRVKGHTNEKLTEKLLTNENYRHKCCGKQEVG
jgi:hypothetical protein